MIKKYLILILLLSFSTQFIFPKKSIAQNIKVTDSDCIICPQFVPDCKESEHLVNQTCKKCAHCEPAANETCEKCVLHSQCKPGNICKDNCCIPRTYKTKTTAPKVKSLKKTIENKISCKTPCGIKCCNKKEKCITVDQCKGEKIVCKLPTLKFCSNKGFENLKGRID